MKVNGNRARRMWKSFAKGQVLLTVRIEWARRRLEKQIIKNPQLSARETVQLSQKLDGLLVHCAKKQPSRKLTQAELDKLYEENQMEDILREVRAEAASARRERQ